MATSKQIEANRRNSQKSTGPRTAEGKARTRSNALRHGLLARQALLPGEDGAGLQEIETQLLADLQPVGALESLFAGRITSGSWRLRRAEGVEAGIFLSTFWNF